MKIITTESPKYMDMTRVAFCVLRRNHCDNLPTMMEGVDNHWLTPISVTSSLSLNIYAECCANMLKMTPLIPKHDTIYSTIFPADFNRLFHFAHFS